MKNMFFTFLISAIFALTAIGTFFFWFKANKVAWKYRRKGYNIWTALSPEEKIVLKKHIRKSRFFFFVGMLILVLLFLIYGIGGFFEK